MSLTRLSCLLLLALATAQFAAAADPECLPGKLMCQFTNAEKTPHSLVHTYYEYTPESLLGEKPPIKHTITIEVKCVYASGRTAVKLGKKISTGFYQGDQKCADLVCTKAYPAANLKVGDVVGRCGDFEKGNTCPAPKGG